MTTAVQTQSEYRDLPIDWLVESSTNPRQTFDEDALQELAASIREHGVLSPLLVRPQSERRFEIVFGARRYRGAALAERETVPVCIREMTDAQVLEAQLVENLQRQDVHPLHEAQGFAALLRLEEPRYSIELIGAKCGKSAGYVASRLRLTELAPAAVEAFTKDEIGLGHALLLAKLQSGQQEEALAACWQESYTNGSKSKRILLPVRHLREWIERNILPHIRWTSRPSPLRSNRSSLRRRKRNPRRGPFPNRQPRRSGSLPRRLRQPETRFNRPIQRSQEYRLRIFCPAPVCPPFCDAPARWQERRPGPPDGQNPTDKATQTRLKILYDQFGFVAKPWQIAQEGSSICLRSPKPANGPRSRDKCHSDGCNHLQTTAAVTLAARNSTLASAPS